MLLLIIMWVSKSSLTLYFNKKTFPLDKSKSINTDQIIYFFLGSAEIPLHNYSSVLKANHCVLLLPDGLPLFGGVFFHRFSTTTVFFNPCDVFINPCDVLCVWRSKCLTFCFWKNCQRLFPTERHVEIKIMAGESDDENKGNWLDSWRKKTVCIKGNSETHIDKLLDSTHRNESNGWKYQFPRGKHEYRQR